MEIIIAILLIFLIVLCFYLIITALTIINKNLEELYILIKNK